MGMKWLVLLALFTFVMVISCAQDSDKYTSPVTASVLSQYQGCNVNSDCVWFNNGCCDCANGGQETAVNRNMNAQAADLFNCAGVACTMRAKIPPCGTGSVFCNSNKCEFLVNNNT